MAVKVWQGEQQQRQDDLSKVDGTGRNRGSVDIIVVDGDIGGPMPWPMPQKLLLNVLLSPR